MTLRSAAKAIAFRSGALDLLHRTRNAYCLTVLMFHRVQPVSERERTEADAIYSITPALLAGIVEFMKRQYAIVSLADVVASLAGEAPLPRYPALITFDDGWRDNLEWALPVFRGLPWTVFVATDALQEPDVWWQEVLLWTLRTGRCGYADLWERAASFGAGRCPAGQKQDRPSLLVRYGELPPDRRRGCLEPYERAWKARDTAPQMLSAVDVAALVKGGVNLGAHGASHLPLAHIADPLGDLRRSKETLGHLLDIAAVSLPHGSYDANVIAAARQAGFCVIFTSDPVLNPCPGGWLQSDTMGRISLSARGVCDRNGGLAKERLAANLYMRDVRSPDGRARTGGSI